MEKVQLYINGTEFSAPANATILEVASSVGIHIPTLCAFKDYAKDGLCRICLVEIEGQRKLQPACTTRVQDGMKVQTNSERVIKSRVNTLDLICSSHRMDCEYCARYGNCELHALVREHGLDDRKYMRLPAKPNEDLSSPCIVRDKSKCVQCRRCVNACKTQTTDIISALSRGHSTEISSPVPLAESLCIGCGQCVAACPTGALKVKDDTTEVWKAIRNRGTHVLAIVAPGVAENIGRHLHDESNSDGKLAALLRRIGFDTVVKFEPASTKEYIKDESFSKKFAAVSASCPAAEKYIRDRYPKLTGNLVYPAGSASGIAAAFKKNAGEKVIFAVSISPCTAAKLSLAPELNAEITTAELENMIQRACLSRFTMNQVWSKLPSEDYDVCPETAKGEQMRTRVVCGLGNAVPLISDILSDSADYDVLEIMVCPGGCTNGGGRYLD